MVRFKTNSAESANKDVAKKPPVCCLAFLHRSLAPAVTRRYSWVPQSSPCLPLSYPLPNSLHSSLTAPVLLEQGIFVLNDCSMEVKYVCTSLQALNSCCILSAGTCVLFVTSILFGAHPLRYGRTCTCVQ